MISHKWCAVAAVFVVTALLGTPRGNAEPKRKQALQLFSKAKRAYQKGRFERAVKLLRRAYRLHSEPLLQYNLGRSLEALDDLEGAVDAYRLYLRTGKDLRDRPALEKRVTILENRLREREKAAASKQRLAALEAELAVRSPPTPPRKPSALPWVVTGAGAAGLMAGGAIGYLAVRKRREANSEPVQSIAAEKERQATRLGRVSTGLLIGGGVVAVAGITWLLLDRRGVRDSKRAVHTRVGFTGTMALIRVDF